jgi:hypothetical protein
MQLHDFELYSMVELVEPGLFNGYGDFERSRAEIAQINSAVQGLRSPTPDRDEVLEAQRLLERFGASEELIEATQGSLAERTAVAEWLSRCHRLSQALVRNRKAEIGGFTRRIAHRIEVEPSAAELKLQTDVLAFIRDWFASPDRRKRTAVGLVMVAFQKMLCSSSRALAGALETRAARLSGDVDAAAQAASDDADMVEQERRLQAVESSDAAGEVSTLKSLARRARAMSNAKLDALESLVDEVLSRDPDEKVLIFSQFLESIEMIRERLARNYPVQVFHGGMSRDEKDAAHDSFRRGTRVLVSSEAGGEGRNFQFCHVVVNYDLPWNPMKIEQRIGRVDRVGQTRDVEIYNFAVRGMLDERILDVLEHRIKIFTETVGALDPILESFEDEVGRIALGERGEMDEAFERLDAELEEQIRKAQELEALRRDFVLDWRSLQRDEASRLLGRTPRATREDLERFCRTAIARLQAAGAGSVDADPERGLFIRVPGVLRKRRKDVDEDYRGSFEVHDALADERLHFFAMGHPLVEAIIDDVGDPWWSPVTLLESSELTTDELALLVDYRLELHGVRDSGSLITHLVTEDGVREAVSISAPSDPLAHQELPGLEPAVVEALRRMSADAARREASARFDEFKLEHALLVEQERDRLTRLYDSGRGFLDDRVARTEREIAKLEAYGTESQKRILPALQGRLRADRNRLTEIESERAARLDELRTTLPSHRLELLGVAVIVPVSNSAEVA